MGDKKITMHINEASMPRIPIERMLEAARDWSYAEYGKPIGNDAAIGCWQAMFDACVTGEKYGKDG